MLPCWMKMWRIKRKYLKILTFSGLLLFLYITRSLVLYADEQLTRSQSNDMNISSRTEPLTLSARGKLSSNHRDSKNGELNSSDFKALHNKLTEHENRGLLNDSVINDQRKRNSDERKNENVKGEIIKGGSSDKNMKASSEELYYYVDDDLVNDANVSYPPFVKDFRNEGPGEWGQAVNQKKPNITRHGFNEEASTLISVHRHIRDTRLQACKDRKYRDDLPMASVIICFHNEAWSVLLRSVHSVIDQSPPRLLREVILVDDASTSDYLKTPLKVYMQKLGKVKIVRHKAHQGLTRARLAGYDVAKGPALVFLDSHIECFPGWLEPLLDRIATDPRNVPFPHIAYINPKTLGTGVHNTVHNIGVFDWKMLTFDWQSVPQQSNGTGTDPIRSPTMPGGLFAIDKAWFTKIGTYDPGLLYWGGENMELSFKTWMCNGSIEVLPCSQVGHIFRHHNPIKWRKGDNPVLNNVFRVAEVWLDEYRHLVYEDIMLPSPTIDVSDRKKLRNSLHCHDFRWYIRNVCPQCDKKPYLIAGQIRSRNSPKDCVDLGSRSKLYPCHGQGGSQYFQMSEKGAIRGYRGSKLCLVDSRLLFRFSGTKENCTWSIGEDETLYLSTPYRCLTVNESGYLSVRICSGSISQKWIVDKSKFPYNL